MSIPANHPAVLRALADGSAVDTTPARPRAAKGRRAKAVKVERTPGEKAAAEIAMWCELHGWPAPETEYRFAPPRRWKFDVAWPALLVAVEFQGGVWGRGRHVRPVGFTNDCEKMSCAASMGWRVMPVTYAQFKSGQLLSWVRRVMQEAESRS